MVVVGEVGMDEEGEVGLAVGDMLGLAVGNVVIASVVGSAVVGSGVAECVSEYVTLYVAVKLVVVVAGIASSGSAVGLTLTSSTVVAVTAAAWVVGGALTRSTSCTPSISNLVHTLASRRRSIVFGVPCNKS